MNHSSHANLLKRLKQAHGHLAAVIGMIEAERPCADLAQQLHAVESAIHKTKRTLIQDHMEHCIGNALGGTGATSDATLDDFRSLAKYL